MLLDLCVFSGDFGIRLHRLTPGNAVPTGVLAPFYNKGYEIGKEVYGYETNDEHVIENHETECLYTHLKAV